MLQPVLIVAHPGHELRLSAWMARTKPLLCILTDGSGGAQEARTRYSAALAEECGASVGPVFGPMPDRDWYAAILAGNAEPFVEAADRIAAAAAHGTLVVADPVEGYNPMHDLCAAVADRVAMAIGGQRATYPLMVPRQDGEAMALDDEAQAHKRAAVTAYAPLAEEAAALLKAEPGALAEERLLPATFDWPPAMVPAPIYELFGAALAMTGVYREAIGYARHVRPIAMRIGAMAEAA